MANIKGFSGEKRLESQTYATVSKLGSDKSGLDVLPKAMFSVNGTSALTVTAQVYGKLTDEKGINRDVQAVTFGVAHNARIGDVLRFTTGLSASIEATVVEIVDANTIYVGSKLPTGALDDCLLMRHVTLTVDSSGSLSVSSGPNQFIKDSVTETVTEDTATPANNLAQPSAMFVYRNGVQLPVNHDTGVPANTVPVPVQITDASGDINITAGDIGVQLTHVGVNADSTRIGDGTTEWGIEAVTKKGLVKDVLVETAVTAVGAQLPATLGSKADAASLSVTQSTEDKVIQDAIKTAVESLASAGSDIDTTEDYYKRNFSVSPLTTGSGFVTLRTLTADIKRISVTNNSGNELLIKNATTNKAIIVGQGAVLEAALIGTAAQVIQISAIAADAIDGIIYVNFEG